MSNINTTQGRQDRKIANAPKCIDESFISTHTHNTTMCISHFILFYKYKMLGIINQHIFTLHTVQGTSHSQVQWIQSGRVSIASLHSGFISRAMELRSNFSRAGNSRSVGSSLIEQKRKTGLFGAISITQ